ncbi:MAG: IS3 family transposase [Proteobacteria bacterium]|nr:IS3 family transposase [Pseudomonadota bacterium]
MINHCTFQSVIETEQGLFHYLEVYNRQRKHSTNGYEFPAQYKQEWGNNRKEA